MGMEQFRYDGKRVLVSGGATGMGAAVSKLVTELGGEVHVADVKPVDYPVAGAVSMDLRDESSIDAALAEIGAPIHSIFSCAGVSGAPFSPVDVMLINFVGARHLVESAVESMMPEGSSIAFISSIGGLGWEKVLDRVLEFLRHSRLRERTTLVRGVRGRNTGASRRDGVRELRVLEAGHRRVCPAAGGAALSPRHPYQRDRPGSHHDALDGLHAHLADVRRHALQGGDATRPADS